MSNLTPPGPAPEPPPDPSPSGGMPVDDRVQAWTGQPPAYPSSGPFRPEPPRQSSKAMAGWALGLSLAFCVPFGFLVAIGLAITVLVKSRDGRDNGKGMAIAALVISALLVLVNIAYVVILGIDMWRNGWDETERDADGRVTDSGLVSIDRLRENDCVLDFQTVEEVEAGEWATGEVTLVPCDQPHVAEVFAIYPIDADDYVDQRSLDAASARGCLAPFREYVGRSYRSSKLELSYYNPDVNDRSGISNSVVCLVVNPQGVGALVMKGSRN